MTTETPPSLSPDGEPAAEGAPQPQPEAGTANAAPQTEEERVKAAAANLLPPNIARMSPEELFFRYDLSAAILGGMPAYTVIARVNMAIKNAGGLQDRAFAMAVEQALARRFPPPAPTDTSPPKPTILDSAGAPMRRAPAGGKKAH